MSLSRGWRAVTYHFTSPEYTPHMHPLGSTVSAESDASRNFTSQVSLVRSLKLKKCFQMALYLRLSSLQLLTKYSTITNMLCVLYSKNTWSYKSLRQNNLLFCHCLTSASWQPAYLFFKFLDLSMPSSPGKFSLLICDDFSDCIPCKRRLWDIKRLWAINHLFLQ